MSAAVVSDTARKVYTVVEINQAVKGLLESFCQPEVWVAGEVSNLKKHGSGHWYLTLKDREAQLSTILFRGVNLRLKFDLQNGMEVEARGILTVYPPQGQYQFQITQLQPKGIGVLDLAFRQLKEKLSRFGYFDPHRKRRPPRFPRRIALVTSASGDAVRDMLTQLGRRWPVAEVWVFPSRVQGDGAAESIAAALKTLNTFVQIDVILMGRGGGSREDLWAYNEEVVARAIYQSQIPIITGIGHETDVAIADMIADVHALTPTDAAVKAVPDRIEVIGQLDALEARMRGLLMARLKQARQRLKALQERRCFRAPLDRLREQEQRLDLWSERLHRALRQRLNLGKQRLAECEARLRTVLQRRLGLLRQRLDDFAARRCFREPQARTGEARRCVEEWRVRLHRALRRRCETARMRLDELASRRCFRDPQERLREGHRQVSEAEERLHRALRRRVAEEMQRLQALAGRLETLSPLNVLARGYSLTRREADGVVVRTPHQVQPGDLLVTLLAQGQVISRVVEP